MMGVRADMTPQVARIDAHRLKREAPTRLCYMGTVLRTRPDGLSTSRSPLQVGAELYGHAGVESDAEVLQLMLETLTRTGIEPLYVDLGHVGIFRALAREAGLDAGAEGDLFDALQRKARPEIEALLSARAQGGKAPEMLAALAELNGGAEVLAAARKTLRRAPRGVHQALDELERLAARIAPDASKVTFHFDLAELRGYAYQTGVVFAAFTPGHGQEVARGGRYDDIGRVFGRARPATGFSADLKVLYRLARETGAQAPVPVHGILAPDRPDDAALAAKVRELRAGGERVIVTLPGQHGGAAELGCDRRLVERDGTWVVETGGGATTRERGHG